MKRKRFIKLMMSIGYSRNCAAALAQCVSQYGSYSELYRRCVEWSVFRLGVEYWRRKLARSIAVLCEACAEAFGKAGENMRRSAQL